MVRNLGLVSDLTFADAHEEYPDSDLSQIYQEIFLEEDFANADILMLTGAPNNYEEQQRRETLIDYINEFSEDRNTLPIVLTTSSQQKGLLEDQKNKPRRLPISKNGSRKQCRRDRTPQIGTKRRRHYCRIYKRLSHTQI